MAVEVLSEASVAVDVIERPQQPGIVLGPKHTGHSLLGIVVARRISSLKVVLARLVRRRSGSTLPVNVRRRRHRASIGPGTAGRSAGSVAVPGQHVRLVCCSGEGTVLRRLVCCQSSAVIQKPAMEEVVQQVEFVRDVRPDHVVGVVAVHLIEVLSRQPRVREASNWTKVSSYACDI